MRIDYVFDVLMSFHVMLIHPSRRGVLDMYLDQCIDFDYCKSCSLDYWEDMTAAVAKVENCHMSIVWSFRPIPWRYSLFPWAAEAVAEVEMFSLRLQIVAPDHSNIQGQVDEQRMSRER